MYRHGHLHKQNPPKATQVPTEMAEDRYRIQVNVTEGTGRDRQETQAFPRNRRMLSAVGRNNNGMNFLHRNGATAQPRRGVSTHNPTAPGKNNTTYTENIVSPTNKINQQPNQANLV
jgi:hypothetical protein